VTRFQNVATSPIGTETLRDSREQFANANEPASAQALERAEFWPRFLAAALDFAILALFVGVIASFYAVGARIPKQFVEQVHPGATPAEMIRLFGARFFRVLLGLYIVCNWLYFAAAESSAWQATPGKKIVGLYVADPYGRKINFGRASARFFSGRLPLHLPTVGIPYFLINCIVAAFPLRKQALHDRVARCVVFKKATYDFSE
jgi:uncharacterized RDD family membrane protein YckC